MTELRGEVFKEVDATDLGDVETYDIRVGSDTDNITTITVEFKDVSANSKEELDRKLEDMAHETIDGEDVSPVTNLGYEIVNEYDDLYRRVGFVVVRPHLS